MPTDERSNGDSLEPETIAKIEEIVEEKVSEKIAEVTQGIAPEEGTPGSDENGVGQVEGPGSVQPS